MRKFVSLSFCFSLGLLWLAAICGSCSDSDYEIYTAIHGVISDRETGKPLENASVVLSPSGLTKQTGADGVYCFEGLDALQYTLTAQKFGYQTNRKLVTAISGERMEVNIQLSKIQQQ